jgi:predicted DNA-binding protein
MRRITIRITDETYEKLRWLAYRDKRSQHAIIIEILEKALGDIEVPEEVRE